MANPESFLEEVAEEVRRDRLFRFFKKYGWLFIIVILLAICASIFLEWNKNSSTLKARNNGDLLAQAVKESEKGKDDNSELPVEVPTPENIDKEEIRG